MGSPGSVRQRVVLNARYEGLALSLKQLNS